MPLTFPPRLRPVMPLVGCSPGAAGSLTAGPMVKGRSLAVRPLVPAVVAGGVGEVGADTFEHVGGHRFAV